MIDCLSKKTTLNLSNCQLITLDAKTIAKIQRKNLMHVTLKHNQLSDLTPLINVLPTLNILTIDLSYNLITDVDELIQALLASRIRSITLCHNPISESDKIRTIEVMVRRNMRIHCCMDKWNVDMLMLICEKRRYLAYELLLLLTHGKVFRRIPVELYVYYFSKFYLLKF